jgi:hypothetical protein
MNEKFKDSFNELKKYGINGVSLFNEDVNTHALGLLKIISEIKNNTLMDSKKKDDAIYAIQGYYKEYLMYQKEKNINKIQDEQRLSLRN